METNFRDAIAVTRELKSAMQLFNDYDISIKGGNEKDAITFLKQAGQFGYSAMEHAYKHFLYRYYNQKYEDGKIDRETLEESIRFLTEKKNYEDKDEYGRIEYRYRYATHKDLMHAFCEIVKSPVVDLQLIFKESKDGNNEAKHEARGPDPKLMKAALIEKQRFFIE